MTFNAELPLDQQLFQKLYETFNACPTFPGDARGPALDKRNGEILDAMDEISVEDPDGQAWHLVGYARKLKPGLQTLILSDTNWKALSACLQAGVSIWLPAWQKRYMRPLLERISQWA